MEWYTPQDISERYAVALSTVLNWIKNGELQAVNVSKSKTSQKPRWRISKTALRDFEQARIPLPAILRKVKPN